MRMTRTRMFAIFFLIAFGGSWAIAFGFASGWSTSAGRALSIAHVLPILLATLLLQGPILRQPVLAPLGLELRVNRWWLIAWVTPVLMLLISLALGALFFDVDIIMDATSFLASKRALVPVEQLAEFDAYALENPPGHPAWLILQALPAGITINLLIALAEEVGWRGFLFREIRGSFWRRSLLVGLLWGLWFAPSILMGHHFPEHRLEGALSMMVFCLMASPMLTYLRVRSGSVIAAAMARGTILALTKVAADLSSGAGELIRAPYGITGILSVAIVLALFVLYDRVSAQPILFETPTP